MVKIPGNINSQTGHRYVSPVKNGTYRISIRIQGYPDFIAWTKTISAALRVRDRWLKEHGLL